MKRIKIISLLLLCITLFFSGCGDREPKVTGVADDGLWLYCGNERYRSDFVESEQVVSSVTVEGVTYTDIYVCDIIYDGCAIYMTVEYYIEGEDNLSGWCLIVHQAKGETYTINSQTEGAAPEIKYGDGNAFVLDDGEEFFIH